jgi:ankyrin repeat protein
LDAADKQGTTAALAACQQGHTKILAVLRDAGADLDVLPWPEDL